MIEGVEWADDARSAVSGADATVVLTEWNEFRAYDLGEMKSLMAGDLLLDFRNIYSRDAAERAGFRYFDIGRGRQAFPEPAGAS